MKCVFINGDKIFLRPLQIEDLEGDYRNWLNDPEVNSFNSHGRFPKTYEDLKTYVLSANSFTRIVLAVIAKESAMHIGNISLQAINWIDRSAEIAFLLGAKDYWGKGIMFEAGQLLLRHAFFSLNLHRVHCGTSSQNIGMQKLAEKLGFRQEGVRVKAFFNQGSYHNIIEFGLLKNEYYEKDN